MLIVNREWLPAAQTTNKIGAIRWWLVARPGLVSSTSQRQGCGEDSPFEERRLGGCGKDQPHPATLRMAERLQPHSMTMMIYPFRLAESTRWYRTRERSSLCHTLNPEVTGSHCSLARKLQERKVNAILRLWPSGGQVPEEPLAAFERVRTGALFEMVKCRAVEGLRGVCTVVRTLLALH
jgi:hypothetical protein